MKILLLIIGSLIFVIFWTEFLYPYIHIKFSFYIHSLKIKRMAKKYDPETNAALLKLSKELKDIADSEKLY